MTLDRRIRDIPLGNPSATPRKRRRKQGVLKPPPSSIPSGVAGEIEFDLAIIAAAWPRMPAALRTALIAAAIAGSQDQ